MGDKNRDLWKYGGRKVVKFFLLLLLIFEASLGPIFVQYVLNASDMSFGLVRCWPSS